MLRVVFMVALTLGLAAASAAQPSLLVRSSDCPAFIAYEPSEDVSHRPEPGITPADLNPAPDFNERARNFDFAVTVDLDGRLSGGRKPGRGDHEVGGEGFLGLVEIRDGVPHFDGEPLAGHEVAALRAACAEASGDSEKKR